MSYDNSSLIMARFSPDSSQNVTAVKYSHHRIEEPWLASWDEVSGDLTCDLFMA
jgi:hypothetical protein